MYSVHLVDSVVEYLFWRSVSDKVHRTVFKAKKVKTCAGYIYSNWYLENQESPSHMI